MESKEIRGIIKERLAAQTMNEYLDASVAIADKMVEHLAAYTDVKELLCFSPLRSEPMIFPIYEDLIRQGLTLYFPVSRKDGVMEFYRIDDVNEELMPGRFGIKEPQECLRCDDRLFQSKELGQAVLCITPLVAFDDGLNRVGHGAGYYDRWFEKYPKMYKLGIAFECQRCDIIEPNEWDVPLDEIITESRIYKILE